MSMQQGPTLIDIELKYHDVKSQTDALIAQLLRDYKDNYFRVTQELRLKKLELEKMRNKYEPEREAKIKEIIELKTKIEELKKNDKNTKI